MGRKKKLQPLTDNFDFQKFYNDNYVVQLIYETEDNKYYKDKNNFVIDKNDKLVGFISNKNPELFYMFD